MTNFIRCSAPYMYGENRAEYAVIHRLRVATHPFLLLNFRAKPSDAFVLMPSACIRLARPWIDYVCLFPLLRASWELNNPTIELPRTSHAPGRRWAQLEKTSGRHPGNLWISGGARHVSSFSSGGVWVEAVAQREERVSWDPVKSARIWTPVVSSKNLLLVCFFFCLSLLHFRNFSLI